MQACKRFHLVQMHNIVIVSNKQTHPDNSGSASFKNDIAIIKLISSFTKNVSETSDEYQGMTIPNNLWTCTGICQLWKIL
jgi:hypothetical protein